MPPKVSEIFSQKKQLFSFEFFPPKTDEGHAKFLQALPGFGSLHPDFVSCTYGAGGSSRGKTLDIVEHIQTTQHIPAVAHITCVLHTKEEVKEILHDMKRRGINNVLALRGDPPKENPDWVPGPENFKYSWELVAFIHQNFGDHFCIGVAGFPEGHVLCPDRDQDARYLKNKIDHGADFVITQLFFDNKDYFTYVERLRKIGVTVPVLPGILPITDYNALLRFCGMCGASVPPQVHDNFKPVASDNEKTVQAGIEFCLAQCRDLIKNGAPGLHFYTLNKMQPLQAIIEKL